MITNITIQFWKLLTPLIAWAASTSLLVEQTRSPDVALPRDEVEALIWRTLPLDDPKAVEKWLHELRSRPDIKPDLLLMMEQAYHHTKDGERVGPPLMALQQRTDLSSEEIGRVTSILGPIAEAASSLSTLERCFASSGVLVLKNYPSASHEALALSILKRSESGVVESAAMTLANIGTERSLKALRGLSEKVKPAPGNKSRLYETINDAVSQIERRLNVNSPTLTSSAADPNRPTSISMPPSAGKATDAEQQSSFPAVWAVVIAAAIGLLWLLLKRHSKSSE